MEDMDETARLLRREPNFDIVKKELRNAEECAAKETFEKLGWTHSEFHNALREANKRYISTFPRRSILQKLWTNITMFFWRCKKDIIESMENSKNASR